MLTVFRSSILLSRIKKALKSVSEMDPGLTASTGECIFFILPKSSRYVVYSIHLTDHVRCEPQCFNLICLLNLTRIIIKFVWMHGK